MIFFIVVVNEKNNVYDDFYILIGGAMKTEADWKHQVKGLIKGELKRRDVSYHALSGLLKDMGVTESPENIANKISRGQFTAIFLAQCMAAVGCKVIRLEDE